MYAKNVTASIIDRDMDFLHARKKNYNTECKGMTGSMELRNNPAAFIN